MGFLRRQQNYFLLDGITHIVNTLLHSPRTAGTSLYVLWIFAFVIHMYYYWNLKNHPPPKRDQRGRVEKEDTHELSRIFHWSCIDYAANRFSLLESGSELLQTAADIIAHSAGFLLAFRMIESVIYRIGVFVLLTMLLYRRMIQLKYFLSDPKMMPKPLQRLFS